ncbi:protein involved in chromosome condensation [Arthrobacter sp. Hiyo6]|nr:protein involved in chromosome condensation [Arthrobacter sp. Hiyo6]
MVSRVQVADGPMAGWLHSVLSGNYDYECVDSPAELGGSERAVTRAGQVKRSRTRHEKDDRSRVEDRSVWVLGFDNADKLELLSCLVQAARVDADQLADKVDAAENRREAERLRAEALALTETHSWDQLDAVRARTTVEGHKERLAKILAASDNLRAAEAVAKEARARWAAAQKAQQAAMEALAEVRTRLAGLERIVSGLGPRVAASTEVPEERAASLRERFLKQRRSIVHEVIDDVALTVATG